MKILFLVTHLMGGGAERTVSYLSKYMAHNGCEVSILSITDDIFYQIDPKVNLVTLGIDSKSNNLFDRIFKALKRRILIEKNIKEIAPDVVFCIMPPNVKHTIRLRKKMKFKVITSERANPNFISNSKTTEFHFKMFDASDGVVFQTDRAKKLFKEDIQKKSVVIHNAVGNELVYECPHALERKNTISAMGRLSDQKDYPTLIKAFAAVLKKHPDFTLEIYGDGPDKNKLINHIDELGLSDKVILRGVHGDAILQMANSACYVMSSKFEGMPNALMEAMGIGLPCVSTDCPFGPAELIEDGVNGVLVPVGDAEKMADSISKFIEDKEFAAKCGENAKKILQNHSIESISKQYLDFICDVVNQDN